MFDDTLSAVINKLSRLQFAAEIFTSFLPYLANLNIKRKHCFRLFNPSRSLLTLPKCITLLLREHGIPSKRLKSVLFRSKRTNNDYKSVPNMNYKYRKYPLKLTTPARPTTLRCLYYFAGLFKKSLIARVLLASELRVG